jgi:hypothetical protein
VNVVLNGIRNSRADSRSMRKSAGGVVIGRPFEVAPVMQ